MNGDIETETNKFSARKWGCCAAGWIWQAMPLHRILICNSSLISGQISGMRKWKHLRKSAVLLRRIISGKEPVDSTYGRKGCERTN